jgi:hypothetical protein
MPLAQQVTIEELMQGLEEEGGAAQASGAAATPSRDAPALQSPGAGSGPWMKALLAEGDEEEEAAMLATLAPCSVPAAPNEGVSFMPAPLL